jgi:hypothetical protein
MPTLSLTLHQKMNRKPEFRKELDVILMNLNLEVLPFTDENEDQKKRRLWRAEKDVLFFCRLYLPHYFNMPPASFHFELLNRLEKPGHRMITAVPTEFGTTTLTLGYMLHQICFGKRKNIVYGTSTLSKASDMTAMIFVELMYNDRIIQDFGDLTTPKNKDVVSFTTKNNVNVSSIGVGMKIRKHWKWFPDLVILEDLDELPLTQDLKSVNKWLGGAILPKVYIHSNIWINGHFKKEDDIFQKLIKSNLEQYNVFDKKIYQAITPEGKSLWEAKHPISRLLRQKQLMGTTAFNLEKMNIPEPNGYPFRQEWIHYYHPDTLLNKDLEVMTFIDFNLVNTDRHRSIVTIGIDKKSIIIYVLDAFIRETTIENVLDETFIKNKSYCPKIIGINNDSFAYLIKEEYKRKSQQWEHDIYVTPIQENDLTRETRIISLSPLFERGKIRFIRGHSDQEKLQEQLLYYGRDSVSDVGLYALERSIRMFKY